MAEVEKKPARDEHTKHEDIEKLTRGWARRTKISLAQKEQNANEMNIRRVFNVTLEEDDERNHRKEHFITRLRKFTVDGTGLAFYFWTSLVALGCVYNLVPFWFKKIKIFIVVMVFELLRLQFYIEWVFLNLFFDGIFLVDLFVLTRIEIVVNGVVVREVGKLLEYRVNELRPYFLMDILCIMPTDVLLLYWSDWSLLRLNRLAKCYRLTDFASLTEMRSSMPNLFRLSKLVFTCFIIFHWNGCLYFLLSIVYNFEKALLDDWIFSWDKIPDPYMVSCDQWKDPSCLTNVVEPLRKYADWENVSLLAERNNAYWLNRTNKIKFSNFTKQYGLSFYWSALTLTTLGEQPWPNTTFQCVFEIADTLLAESIFFSGLVIFATIVGDVGNMVTTMNAIRTSYEECLDGGKSFMTARKVMGALQTKVVSYLDFVWKEGKMNVDEKAIADFMPPRLYGELVVHIHMETLRRVKLFEDCEPNLLYELILRLELQVFSTGDYICRKGEVGKEMYIVKSGFVEVVSEDGKKVFVRLGEGTVFGELSILNIPGNKNGNKRTANVRSVGFCDLYTLSKENLWAVLHEYPHAKQSLIQKGKALLQKDNLLEEVIDENELDFEGDVPLDILIESVRRVLYRIDEDLTKAEKDFAESARAAKARLFAMENDFIELINGVENLSITSADSTQGSGSLIEVWRDSESVESSK